MPEQNLILAFDTSSDYLACAIGKLNADGTITLLACADQPARREANVKLLPAIDGMLAQAGLKKSKVQAVVCGLGPGSFTGVRIAVASAKGIARGLGVPLYGVSTLDSIAWAAWLANVHGTLGVVADAMRGEIYPARFTLDVTGVQRLDSHTVAKAADVAPKWSAEKNLQLAGDGLCKFSELFCGFEVLPEALWAPTGAGVLRAFEAKLSGTMGTGQVSQSWDTCPVPIVPGTTTLHSCGNPATLLPIYTRLADAEENERRRLAAGGEIAQGALVEVPASGVNDVASAASTVGTVNAAKVANTASTACTSRQTESPLSPTGAVFRPAANQDLDAMTVLEEQLFAKELVTLSGECWSRKMFADDLPRKDRSWWVCYTNNQLAGFAGGQVLDGQLHVLDLAVAEQYRHQGIASKLVSLLAEDGKALGATSITLEVRATNNAAQNLYKKLGLLQQGVRPRYYAPEHIGEPRVDAVIMTGAIESVSAFTHPVPFATTATTGTTGTQPVILAIETSCDETAAAVIDGNAQLLSNVIASQVDFHARFGGVVPEIASRKHTEAIVGVVDEAMAQAQLSSWQDLNAIAVTYAPGLIGALVVGMAFAKGLSWATNLPLIRVNHLEGHIYANKFADEKAATTLTPPFVIALLSGGNTMLVHVKAWGEYRVLGQTLDDAVGEAFDKVAKALGLGYPGGPIISRLAAQGDPKAIDFPRALMHSKDLQFSLSGLKTAVVTYIKQQQADDQELNIANIAASFEQAVIDVQVAKALTACKQSNVQTFCIGGGVAANKALRNAYQKAMEPAGIQVVFPPQLACTDNAAMIASVALDRYQAGNFSPLSSDAQANADLEQPY